MSACADRSSDPRIPADYPADYVALVDAAEAEGKVVVWSSTDRAQVTDLLAAFASRYPKIVVEYRELPATELNDRFLADARKGAAQADLLWSSAMDLQIKLVNDGYAQPYKSPERSAIAAWANWKDQAWGVTAEPIVFVYNRKLMGATTPPDSHDAFRKALLSDPRFKGRVATLDPAKSALGYLLAMHDELADHNIEVTAQALGTADATLLPTTQSIIAEVSAGHAIVGYNVLGSYAAEFAKHDPSIAVVLPRDYTLLASRIATIPVGAPHPDAARVFLTFLLSRDGQAVLAKHSMSSVRTDVPAPKGLSTAGVNTRAIRVSPALLLLQDRLIQRRFMHRWQEALDRGDKGRATVE